MSDPFITQARALLKGWDETRLTLQADLDNDRAEGLPSTVEAGEIAIATLEACSRGLEDIVNRAECKPTEVFVLLSDGDRTMRSVAEPFGVAVTTEAEAKRYVAEGDPTYDGYQRLRVYADYDDGCRAVYGKLHDECKAARAAKAQSRA